MYTKHYIYLFFISSLLISCNNGDSHSVFSVDDNLGLINEKDDVIPLKGDYLIGNKEAIYNAVLGEFDSLLKKANKVYDNNKRLAALAEAESKLIDSTVFMPYSYGNINYQLTRIVPNTYYAINDTYPYSFKNILLVDSLIDKDMNKEINKLYANSYNDEKFYSELIDLLSNNNYSLNNELKVFYDNEYISLNPYDNLSYANKMLLRQVFDSFFEYDVFGNIKCNLAKDFSFDYDTNELTIQIKDNAYWYKDGNIYDKIDVYDFLYSYKLLLSNNKFCKYIENSYEYCKGLVEFCDVGIKVIDSNTIKYKTSNLEGLLHFLTTLMSSPVHEDFVNSNYNNKIYSGCYYIKSYDLYNVSLTKINGHYNSENSYINDISFSLEYLINREVVNKVVDNKYSFISFINNKELYDELLEDELSSYLINTSPNNNVYYSLFNLNRTDYFSNETVVKSSKTEKEHLNTWLAIQDINFRKAIYHCIDKRNIDNNIIKNTFTTYNFKYLDNECNYNGSKYQKYMSYGDIVQSFLDYNIKDGCNDSFNEEKANYYFNKFTKNNNIQEVIKLDLLYFTKDKEMANLVNCFKNDVDNYLNGKVIINLIGVETRIQYLYALDDRSYDILFGFGHRQDEGSIYNNLYEFTINGTNSTLIL